MYSILKSNVSKEIVTNKVIKSIQCNLIPKSIKAVSKSIQCNLTLKTFKSALTQTTALKNQLPRVKLVTGVGTERNNTKEDDSFNQNFEITCPNSQEGSAKLLFKKASETSLGFVKDHNVADCERELQSVSPKNQTSWETFKVTEIEPRDSVKEFPGVLANSMKSLASDFKNLEIAEKFSPDKQCVLEITRRGSFEVQYCTEPFKYVLNSAGVLKFVVLNKGVVKEDIIFENNIFLEKKASAILLDFSDIGNIFCNGIASDSKDILSTLPNKPRNLIIYEYPIKHVASKRCPGWFKKGNRIADNEGNVCKECKSLLRYLRNSCLRRRVNALSSPSARKRRSDPSSTHPTSFLSPHSLAAKKIKVSYRYQNLKNRNIRLKAKLNELKISVTDQQHDDMKSATSIIRSRFSGELETILSEESETNETTKEARRRLRQVWEEDTALYSAIEKEDFRRDQQKNENGKHKNRWSIITYRIALAIACRSKAAYEALRGFNILNLPSWRSMQRKTAKNLDEPGINYEYLQDQKKTYDMFRKEQVSLGLAEPKSDGLLIFDEVKVAAKIIWNSKNHKIMGLAMRKEEYAYLDDLYSEVSDEKTISKANYMLQFLWRDLTSNYDVIGPYFSTASTADAHFTFGCLLQVIKAFQCQGFNVCGIICDGASSNLSVLKMMVRVDSFPSYKTINGEIDVKIPVSFPNPFRLDRNIYFITCPSHQLKNMINQLFASDPERAKDFSNNGTRFGWKQIVNLKMRDDELRDRGVPRLVPGLVQSYVERDAWTKLNVKPARILQQNEVLSALFEYANPPNGEDKPQDASNVMETYNYLKACKCLFEDGFFQKHRKIDSLDSPIIKNLDMAMNYFTNWLKYLLDEDKDFNPGHPRQKKFISWQTWALLRVMVYGLKGLSEEYLRVYPSGDHYLSPIRINGSAVETLFSQYKHAAGGKLTSINFNTSRKAILTKIDIKGHHSGQGYRDVPLYVRESFEEKYGQK